MAREHDTSIILYNAEKAWIQEVHKILLNFIPEIQTVIQKMGEYDFKNKLEYGGADRYAWMSKGNLIIQTQNFRFTVTDDEREFRIKYEVLDEYTREHCGRMYAVSYEANFIQLFKKLTEDNVINYVNYNNYRFFEYFMGEMQSLIDSE
jgi:hypothetical protein